MTGFLIACGWLMLILLICISIYLLIDLNASCYDGITGNRVAGTIVGVAAAVLFLILKLCV